MKTKTKQWTRWSLAIGLAILAGGLLTTLGRSSLYAQSSAARTAGKDSVFVVSAQLSKDTHGLYLVDYENKTICVYQYSPKDRKLRWLASRTYEFDAQMDEYNTDEPRPRDVKTMITQHKRLAP